MDNEQKIKEYVDKLPKPLQQAVLSPEWRKRLGEIGVKYSLHLDQISSLEYEVLFVMIGMEPEGDLVTNIQTELSVSKILAEQLAGDINVRIFQYIMKSLEERTPDKSERFVETNKEVQITNNESEKTNEAIQEQEDLPSAPPVKIQEAPMMSASASYAPLPKLTVMPREGEVDSGSEAGMTEEKPHQKIAPPPMNLPGGEDVEEDQGIRHKAQGTTNTETTQTSEIVHHNSYIVTPPSEPALATPLLAPSLADTKLSGIVRSESETVVKAEQQPIFKSYTSDPYREPLE